jgi:hypothetical protein
MWMQIGAPVVRLRNRGVVTWIQTIIEEVLERPRLKSSRIERAAEKALHGTKIVGLLTAT